MSKKILIVDDEMNIMKVIKSRLTLAGYEVVTADRGQAALQVVRSENPDLILLDLGLPDMDGMDVLEKIKDSPETQSIPVIILSVLDTQELVAKAKAMKAIDYIVKPFAPDLLLGKVKKACPVSV